jgi:hypothetical protein
MARTKVFATMTASTGTAASASASVFPNPIPIAETVHESSEQSPRTSLNGAWILDKTTRPREEWSMKHYLAVLNVHPLAIEAHDQGEMQHDVIHTIYMDQRELHVTKGSSCFKNENDGVNVVLEFGQRHVEHLPPGNREKSSIATTTTTNNSDDEFGKQFKIESTLEMVNGGKAQLTEVCELHSVLQQESGDGDGGETRSRHISRKSFMLQTLTIVNQRTGQQLTTKRYFLPYNNSDDDVTTAAAGSPPSPPPAATL